MGTGYLGASKSARARLSSSQFRRIHWPLCCLQDLLAPLPAGTKRFAIYSTEDQVVTPEACVMDGATNIKVTGTHSGLVFNKAVYPHIAEALAS
jgi:hypothetical protein